MILNSARRILLPSLGFALYAMLAGRPAAAQFQRAGGNPFAAPAATTQYARVPVYHVKHLEVHLIMHTARKAFDAVAVNTLTPLKSPLASVVLDAGKDLVIHSCTIDGKSAQYKHDGDKLTVFVDGLLQPGTFYAVQVTYSLPGPDQGGGANGVGGFTWLGPGTSTPASPPTFYTQGETRTNRDWVPCYDYPNDKCASETVTTVPATWTVIGNGTEGAVQFNKAKNTRTYTWTMTQPHSTYLLSLVGGQMDVKYSHWGNVPLIYAVPAGLGYKIDASFGNTPDMLSFYSNLLHFKYPWPKYAQDECYSFPGGMENVSATTLGPAQNMADSRSGHYPLADLISHELAHQWFGDLVTCGDWGDIWLNEGFANFFEAFYMRHLEGQDKWQEEKQHYLDGYLNESHRYERPIVTNFYENPDVLFDSTTYDKGALVLVMLLHRLGPKMFFKCLHQYLVEHEYGNAVTADLAHAFTEVTGKDMSPFFDQWVMKPGHPVLDMTWSYVPESKSVTVVIKQEQSTANGTPIYHTPVTLGFLDPSGSGFTLRRTDVEIDATANTFTLPASVKPSAVLLDPDHWLIKDEPHLHWTTDELPVILKNAPDWVDRLAAAQKIAALHDGLNQDTAPYFVAQLSHENAFQVSTYMIDQLGKVSGLKLTGLLETEMRTGSDQTRAAAMHALSKSVVDADTLAYIGGLAASNTASYTLTSAAIVAYGRLAGPASLQVLSGQFNHKPAAVPLQFAVMDALSGKHIAGSTALLITIATSDSFRYLRFRALRALVNAPAKSAPVHACLVSLLKDTDTGVVRSAIRTLVDRHDLLAVPQLQDLEAHANDQGIKQAASDAVSNLESK